MGPNIEPFLLLINTVSDSTTCTLYYYSICTPPTSPRLLSQTHTTQTLLTPYKFHMHGPSVEVCFHPLSLLSRHNIKTLGWRISTNKASLQSHSIFYVFQVDHCSYFNQSELTTLIRDLIFHKPSISLLSFVSY